MFKRFFLLLALFVASCGFHPLYGNNGEVMTDAQAIQIEPISGEDGYRFGLVLKNRLNPSKEQVSKKYRLTVLLEKPVYANESMRSDNFASIKQMSLTAKYTLVEIKTNKTLISASVDSRGIFNLIRDPYATVVSEDKLHENLIRTMAEDVATHVLAYFKGVHP